MPTKINCGLSKKIGQPNYGSLGASCHVEFEIEGSLLQTDLMVFHRHVRNIFVACQEAVNDELARHQHPDISGTFIANGRTTGESAAGTSNGNVLSDSRHLHGNGVNGQRASQRQIEYIHQLVRQIPGLSVPRLEKFVQRVFDKPIADLTSLDASGLIDTLKAIKAGVIDLDQALSGAAT
jgi:hypothetical protein